MIARELYISGLREFLGTQKIEMPVLEEINYMGPLTLEILYPPISMLESFVKQSYECLSYLIDQAVGGAAKTQV